jgi:hypothetical protein
MFLINPPNNVRALAQAIPCLSENEIRLGWMVLLDLGKGSNPQTLRMSVKDGTLNLVGIWRKPTSVFANTNFFK